MEVGRKLADRVVRGHMRTNSKTFIAERYPELQNYRCLTSRLYPRSEKSNYRDDWWFNFFDYELDDSEYIVFVGAKDKLNLDFQVFKVPTSFLKANLNKLSRTDRGWINIYLHVETFDDVRSGENGLSFRRFAL